MVGRSIRFQGRSELQKRRSQERACLTGTGTEFKPAELMGKTNKENQAAGLLPSQRQGGGAGQMSGKLQAISRLKVEDSKK